MIRKIKTYKPYPKTVKLKSYPGDTTLRIDVYYKFWHRGKEKYVTWIYPMFCIYPQYNSYRKRYEYINDINLHVCKTITEAKDLALGMFIEEMKSYDV